MYTFLCGFFRRVFSKSHLLICIGTRGNDAVICECNGSLFFFVRRLLWPMPLLWLFVLRGKNVPLGGGGKCNPRIFGALITVLFLSKLIIYFAAQLPPLKWYAFCLQSANCFLCPHPMSFRLGSRCYLDENNARIFAQLIIIIMLYRVIRTFLYVILHAEATKKWRPPLPCWTIVTWEFCNKN